MPTRSSRRRAALAIAIALVAAPSAAQEEKPGSDPPAPRSAADVARRALILRAVHALRLEPRAGEAADRSILDRFDAERKRVVTWLRSEKLLDYATRWERDVLTTPAGELGAEDGAAAGRQGEPLDVMLFALGLIDELPRFDAATRRPKATASLPATGEPTGDFIAAARLRSEKEITRALDVAVLWHWRAQTRELARERRFPEGADFERSRGEVLAGMRRLGLQPREIHDGESLFGELVRFSAYWAHREGMIAEPIDADFPVGRKAYRDLDEREFRRLGARANARHRALNWIKGLGASWDDVPADL